MNQIAAATHVQIGVDVVGPQEKCNEKNDQMKVKCCFHSHTLDISGYLL